MLGLLSLRQPILNTQITGAWCYSHVWNRQKRVMAEIFGKATGINGGRGGSMHVNDIDFGNMGFNGIQGSITLTALGTAFASQYKGTDEVSVVFMGDGTLGEGACHESINLAATWKLPVIYALINNQYAISTHYTEAHPQKQLATWADGYGVPNEVVDGNDVEAVYEATTRAVQRARKGEGPTLLEFMTYRWQGHFAGIRLLIDLRKKFKRGKKMPHQTA